MEVEGLIRDDLQNDSGLLRVLEVLDDYTSGRGDSTSENAVKISKNLM